MKFSRSARGFSLEAVPISSGALSSLLLYRRPDVGNLFSHLEPQLLSTPKVLSSDLWFTLVNVSCMHNQFSYGLCDTPPKEARPLSNTWLYTFAITPARYQATDKPAYTSLRGINMRAWGFEGTQFLTLGTTHSDAGKYGLSYDAQTGIRLYYLLGALSKKAITQARSVNDLDMERARDTIYMKPLYNLMRNVPWRHWVYNRQVWRNAPHLLCTDHLTPDTLMYHALFVGATSRLAPLTEARALDLLHESLTSSMSRYRHDMPARSTSDLLFTAYLNKQQLQSMSGSVSEKLDWLRSLDLQAQTLDSITETPNFLRRLLYEGV